MQPDQIISTNNNPLGNQEVTVATDNTVRYNGRLVTYLKENYGNLRLAWVIAVMFSLVAVFPAALKLAPLCGVTCTQFLIGLCTYLALAIISANAIESLK